MKLVIVAVGIIAASMLGVLVQWLLKGLSDLKPTSRNITTIVISCIVIALFAAWSDNLPGDYSTPTQNISEIKQPSPESSAQAPQPTATVPQNIELQIAQKYEIAGWERTEILFSSDGNTLFAKDGDVIKAWEVETGIKIREYQSPISESGIQNINISEDGSKLVAGIGNGSFAIWDIATGEILNNINSDSISIYDGYRAFDVDINANGQTIVGSTSKDFGAWDLANGQKNFDPEYTEWVMEIQFLPQSNDTFIAGFYYGTIALMNLKGEKIKFYEGASSVSGNNTISVSENGDLVAAPVPINQRSVRVWHTDTALAVYTLEADDNTAIESVVFSPNDFLFAGSTFGNIWIWDAKNGNQIYRQKIDIGIFDIAIRPYRNQVATVSERGITLWNILNLTIH